LSCEQDTKVTSRFPARQNKSWLARVVGTLLPTQILARLRVARRVARLFFFCICTQYVGWNLSKHGAEVLLRSTHYVKTWRGLVAAIEKAARCQWF
jgi:hypothetical protein